MFLFLFQPVGGLRHQRFQSALSATFRFQEVLFQFSSMSSLHHLFLPPLDIFLWKGLQYVIRFVHILSVILAT